MNSLTNEKKVNLLRIKKARLILSSDLKNKLIEDENIEELFNMPVDYGITSEETSHNYKSKVLKQIYNSPFLLCDQENLSVSLKRLLPEFLNHRYNMEMEELDKLLELDYISIDEYLDNKEMLKFLYYESSKEGLEISKKEKIKIKV